MMTTTYSKLKNVAKAATSPQKFMVMAKKAIRRLHDKKGRLSIENNMEWIQRHCEDFVTLARVLNRSILLESEIFESDLKKRAAGILSGIEHDLGGGGFYKLLYFVARITNPGCIVETGVAAGFSSAAFLSAIDVNRKGLLYSSDFPYFRLPNPERYIGIVVDDSLRNRWKLYLKGDEINLPVILSQVTQVDIFHYDSDKSYSGREFAMSMIESKLAAKGIIIMDDIQDNSFFHDLVIVNRFPEWHIFRFEDKYVGLIGSLPYYS